MFLINSKQWFPSGGLKRRTLQGEGEVVFHVVHLYIIHPSNGSHIYTSRTVQCLAGNHVYTNILHI